MGWSASSLASTSTTQSAVPFRVNGQLPIVTFNKLTVFGIRLYEAMSARAVVPYDELLLQCGGFYPLQGISPSLLS